MKALSIRQPWAWAIVDGHKRVENRTWSTSYRGPLLIHASKGLSQEDYAEVLRRGRQQRFKLPYLADLERGGFIGMAQLVGIVTKLNDPWFNGPYGWILESPRRIT